MLPVLVMVWWFAAIDPSGETVILEYRTLQSCQIVQRAYARTKIKTTTCQTKERGMLK